MFKKTLLAVAVLLSSGAAFANGGSFAPAEPLHTGAFYIGAAFSGDIASFDTSNTVQNVTRVLCPDCTRQVITETKDFDWKGDGIDGQLFAGYGMTFQDHWTLAAEVFGSMSSLKGEYDGCTFADNSCDKTRSADIKLKHTLGVALLPGVRVNDATTLYGRVGYVNSRFELDEDHAFTQAGILDPIINTFDDHKNENGLQLGLGMEAMITNNCGIRGEYTWERYSNLNFNRTANNLNTDFLPISETATSTLRIKPTVHTVNLGLDYHFYS